jgi:hypothetical protein
MRAKGESLFVLVLLAASIARNQSYSVPMTKQQPNDAKGVQDMVAPKPPPDLQPEFAHQTLLRVPSRMNYVDRSTVKAVIQRDPNGFDSPTHGAVWREETVWVENGRLGEFKLHPNGFELAVEPVAKDINFLSKDDVLDRYYPHCQEILERSLRLCSRPSGTSTTTVTPNNVRVWAFDHNVRTQSDQPQSTQKPLGLVHGDYTTVSGPRRLQLLAEPPKINDVWRDRLTDNTQQPLLLLDPTMVQECLDGKRRFALVNVWRNIDVDHSVASMPLACVDALTVEPRDLRVLEVHYQDRIGENFLVCPGTTGDESTASSEAPSQVAATSDSSSGPQHPRHRWVYFPGMVYDECMFIKQWDSAGDYAQSQDRDRTISTFAIHSAFQDPTTPHDARPRQSIEVRCIAIWDPE